ncbi:MAG: hypothetical protein PUB79_07025 [Succinivibrio sp.]|jgi:hypothetical protein|nr:hypothetical protein [Succinivibrio sp.]MCI6448928.1 hypothetical protein [Succinivibrio sp.]MDD6068565.1 hypothetical protein [Succinivibrio sp.]MDY3107719.1 hypothetical protein [Succinivibrio sp.]MDY4993727.1 hypothetical protein [Succinivibrio sp.]
MFNPVFNQDGRVSYFRVTCLAIAIGCFVTGCVMHQETQEVTQVTDTVVSDEVAEVETSDSENFEEIRKLALSQIKNATLYLQTCGELDNTFDNCSFDFTKEFTQYYQVKLDAFADGFDLTVKAKSNNNDSCKLFKVDSNGSYTAFNQDNTQDESCISDLANSLNTLTIHRDTDYKEGQIAPSGLSPIVHNLSQR